MTISPPSDFGNAELTSVEQFSEKADRPKIPFGSGRVVCQDSSIITEFHGDIGSLLEVYTYQVTLDPRRRAWPGQTAPEAIIPLRFGYGLYWDNTSGDTWSYNPSVFLRHGPEGVNLSGNNAYMIGSCNEGALIGVTPYNPNPGPKYIVYKEEFDKSRGGLGYYKNDYGSNIVLDFWLNINDTRDGYGDNDGFMNANVVVFRI